MYLRIYICSTRAWGDSGAGFFSWPFARSNPFGRKGPRFSSVQAAARFENGSITSRSFIMRKRMDIFAATNFSDPFCFISSQWYPRPFKRVVKCDIFTIYLYFKYKLISYTIKGVSDLFNKLAFETILHLSNRSKTFGIGLGYLCFTTIIDKM